MFSTVEKSASATPQPLLTQSSVTRSVIGKVPIAAENIALFSLVVIYICAVYLVEAMYGLQGMVNIQWNYSFLNIPTFALCGTALSVQLLRRAFQLPASESRWRLAWRDIQQEYCSVERIAGCIIIYCSFPLFMSACSSVKQMIPEIHPFTWDYTLMRVDFVLHGGHHPWELLHGILGYPTVTWALDRWYMVWFLLLFGFSLWMTVSSRRRLRLQYLLCFGLYAVLLGNLLATVISSVGPCYFAKVTSEANPYAVQMAYLQAVNTESSLWAIQNQEVLWHLYSSKLLVFFSGISAMPSMHIAATTLFALAGWQVHRWLGIFLIGNLILTQIASVHLAWHYAVDGYVSILLTWILWRIAGYAASLFLENTD